MLGRLVLLPMLLLGGILLLARALLLLLAGLAGVLAWLALPRALLLLLLLVLLVGAVLLVGLLRHFLHSFRLVISKPVGLLRVHGHRLRKNPSVGERGASLKTVSEPPLRSIWFTFEAELSIFLTGLIRQAGGAAAIPAGSGHACSLRRRSCRSLCNAHGVKGEQLRVSIWHAAAGADVSSQACRCRL